jgi:hypothetical protein
VDERRPEPVELAAQVAHVRFHHLGVAGITESPHVMQQLALGQHAALMAHQAGEQPELGRRQPQGRSGPVDRPSGLVEDEVAAAEQSRLCRFRA